MPHWMCTLGGGGGGGDVTNGTKYSPPSLQSSDVWPQRTKAIGQILIGIVSSLAGGKEWVRWWKLIEGWVVPHCEKSLFVLGSHQKIPWPRIDQSSCWYQDIFPASYRSFSHSPCQKTLRKETFCIPQYQKSLPVPGMRHFTFLHAIKVWPLRGRPGLAPGTRIFRHGGM